MIDKRVDVIFFTVTGIVFAVIFILAASLILIGIDNARMDKHCEQYETVLMRDIETVEIGCAAHFGFDIGSDEK